MVLLRCTLLYMNIYGFFPLRTSALLEKKKEKES